MISLPLVQIASSKVDNKGDTWGSTQYYRGNSEKVVVLVHVSKMQMPNNIKSGKMY